MQLLVLNILVFLVANVVTTRYCQTDSECTCLSSVQIPMCFSNHCDCFFAMCKTDSDCNGPNRHCYTGGICDSNNHCICLSIRSYNNVRFSC